MAAVAALATNLMAQGSGWPPPADHVTLPVWPGVAPGESANMPPEADMTTAKDNLIAGTAGGPAGQCF
jgi:hypothetical protein